MIGVTTRQKTQKCQKRLKDALTKGLNQKSDLTIGYRSGDSRKRPVNHNGVVWVCWRFELRNQFSNAFGLYPDEKG